MLHSVPMLSCGARKDESLLYQPCPEAILVDEMIRERNWLTNEGNRMPGTRYKCQNVFELEDCPTDERMKGDVLLLSDDWLLKMVSFLPYWQFKN